MAKKKKKKVAKKRREVTTDPDERRRSFTLMSDTKITKMEFLEAMIDYIAENAADCPMMLLANEDVGDPSTVH